MLFSYMGNEHRFDLLVSSDDSEPEISKLLQEQNPTKTQDPSTSLDATVLSQKAAGENQTSVNSENNAGGLGALISAYAATSDSESEAEERTEKNGKLQTKPHG